MTTPTITLVYAAAPSRMLHAGPVKRCPACRTPLDGGPVRFRCNPCGAPVMAADLDTEYHPADAPTGQTDPSRKARSDASRAAAADASRTGEDAA